MKKRILAAVAATVAIMVLFAGCGVIQEALSRVAAPTVRCKIGNNYSTRWFDFSVESIDIVTSYAGYTAAPGHKLIDVVVVEKGTFEEPCPMGIYDFRVDHESFEEWYWPLDALDDSMMPYSFDLVYGEEVTYHMVYEVPDLSDLKLIYIELDQADNEGRAFVYSIEED